MDIFDFAIQMERDGEQFYRDAAARTPHKGLQTILILLAEDEKKHARVITDMHRETGDMEPTAVLDRAKNVFVQMKAFGGRIDLSGDEAALYSEAMVLEQRSIDFYLDRAEQVRSEDQKALFRRLADEEQQHYRLLQEMAELIKQPRTWLENARFSHLDAT
jgi:rubrerythrin